MPVIKCKPTSPGRRFVVKVVHPDLHKGAPFAALGSSLGAHDSLLGSLWTSKTLKNCRFFKVLGNAACLLFAARDGALGLVLPVHWADLASKWAPKWLQNEPKMDPKIGSKKGFKTDETHAENGAQ